MICKRCKNQYVGEHECRTRLDLIRDRLDASFEEHGLDAMYAGNRCSIQPEGTLPSVAEVKWVDGVLSCTVYTDAGERTKKWLIETVDPVADIEKFLEECGVLNQE